MILNAVVDFRQKFPDHATAGKADKLFETHVEQPFFVS